jgi:hypothetical protein
VSQGETLQHSGVKGMHWGIHRTPQQLGHPAPRKRRAVKIVNRLKKAANQKKSTSAFRDPKKMTLEDLTREVSRMEKEKKYLELTGQQKNKTAGWVKTALKNAAQSTLQAAAGQIFSTLLANGVSSIKGHYADKAAAKAQTKTYEDKKKNQKTYLDSGHQPPPRYTEAGHTDRKYTRPSTSFSSHRYTEASAKSFVDRYFNLNPDEYTVHSDN